jgi:hypothetical protein
MPLGQIAGHFCKGQFIYCVWQSLNPNPDTIGHSAIQAVHFLKKSKFDDMIFKLAASLRSRWSF